MDSHVNRRDFLKQAGMSAAVGGLMAAGAGGETPKPARIKTRQHCVVEIEWRSTSSYADSYNEVEVDVTCTRPDGTTFTSPAFWAGGDRWVFRFAGDQLGEYQLKSSSNQTGDTDLHARKATVTVTAAEGDDPLLRHGRVKVAANKRYLEHADGTPFLWLGDTWWMGLTTRLDWPKGFKELAEDRVNKGFSVIQIIAGPYPDMDAWDARGRNEAGFPFEEDFARINPAYYDYADRKIAHLVECGLMPCIVGMWGYYLPQLGVDKVKRFWRYLVARYGAYPVAWCICGEGVMPYYLSENREADAAAQKKGWTEVMAHVRAIDGYRNPIGIHPTQFGREQVEDPTLMDFEMLQTGHGDIDSVPNVIKCVRQSVGAELVMPVVNSEVNYEGIMGRCWQNIQRLDFYHTMLNGAAGFTYGANGIWQLNTREKPYGPSPHGRSWGSTPWQDAAQLPGSAQVGYGAKLLRGLPWWQLESHPEWIVESKKENDPYGTIAAGIPGKLRLIYSPHCWNAPKVKKLGDTRYRAAWFDPCTGVEIDLGPVQPDGEGTWTPPFPPEVHDWMLILRAE
ncbi:MAG: DUF4038 domain-containing protein [Candidatus Hydrogenedentes bacterium]|nr:DUF4038 domain-containing protein [Candidatus Hydrogenedentota bacterium]